MTICGIQKGSLRFTAASYTLRMDSLSSISGTASSRAYKASFKVSITQSALGLPTRRQ